jgi:HK97 family phage major capsid protein
MEDKKLQEYIDGKLKEVADLIGKKDDKIDALIKESVNQAVENAKEEGKQVSDKLKGEIEREIEVRKNLQKQLDDLDSSFTLLKETGARKGKTFSELFIEDLEKDESFKTFARNKKGVYVYEPNDSFFTKDAMTPALNLTGQVTPVQRMAGFFYDPDRSVHMREFMNVIPTSTDTIYYITDTIDTNGVQVTAPGADKGASESSLTQNSETVTKISTYLEIAEEMLDDIPGMTAYLTTRFTSKLKVKEDQQILYGTGASNQLQGITPVAQAYDGDEISLSSVQEVDILRAAIAQARVDEYAPSLIVLHPNDVRDIDILKDSTNNYLHPGIWGNRPNVAGVPIFETTAINEGDFLVGDFRLGATLWDRKQALVKFSDSHSTNFVKNIITVVFEERLAQTVERANAFVYGSFASAKACGSA